MPLFTEIKINKEKLINNFIDPDRHVNLDVIKCYKVLFTKKGLLKNIASYILLFIILIFIISYFIFFLKEEKIIQKKIILICECKKNLIRITKEKKNPEEKRKRIKLNTYRNKNKKKKGIKIKISKTNHNNFVNLFSNEETKIKNAPIKKAKKSSKKKKYFKNNSNYFIYKCPKVNA